MGLMSVVCSSEHINFDFIEELTVPFDSPVTISTKNGYLLVPEHGIVKPLEYAYHGYITVNASDRMMELADKLGYETSYSLDCTKFHDEYYEFSKIVSMRFTLGTLELRCRSLGDVDMLCMKQLITILNQYKFTHFYVRGTLFKTKMLVELYELLKSHETC